MNFSHWGDNLVSFFFFFFSFRRNKCQSAIVGPRNIDFKVKVIDNLIHDACTRWPRMDGLNGQRVR